MSDVRSRSFFLTINNYSADEVDKIRSFYQHLNVYIIIGFEVGEEGTSHLHSYIHFKYQRWLSAIKKAFPRAHIEIPRHTTETIAYCKKDGVFEEHGTPPLVSSEEVSRDKKAAWKQCIDWAKTDCLHLIEENYPGIYVAHFRTWTALKNSNILSPSIDTLENYWVWGPTGSGKSTWAREKAGSSMFLKGWNKWWDGYDHEENVLLEEGDPKVCEHLGHFLKQWADHWPFGAEVKGSHLKAIRPKRIFVTSQFDISDCFSGEDLLALKRRFTLVHMNGYNTIHFHPE